MTANRIEAYNISNLLQAPSWENTRNKFENIIYIVVIEIILFEMFFAIYNYYIWLVSSYSIDF